MGRKDGKAVEKRRIRLEINGVVCWLITQESDEYMQSLAKEVGELLEEMQITSPYITREAAALAAALGYCDDARKNGQRASRLQERVDELEVEAEVWQEEKEELLKNPPVKPDPEMAKRLAFFEEENTRLTAQVQELQQLREKTAALGDENQALREQLTALDLLERTAEENQEKPVPQSEEEDPRSASKTRKKRKNPLRYEEEYEQEGFVSFFEKK